MEHLISHWRPRIIQIVSRYDSSDSAHDLAHLDRVWANAQSILADHPNADVLAIMAACYLHDLVNLPKDSPDRANASRLSAQAAMLELSQLDFPKERFVTITHAIEAHSFSAHIEPKTLEAAIVQDADRLDALGAIGLARMFHISGQLNRALAHPTDPLAKNRALDDKTYALDHIETKLVHLPGLMKTEAGRKLAGERLEVLLRFRERFVEEWR